VSATHPDPALDDRAAVLAAREVDVALRDGSTAHVRPVRGTDMAALHRFLLGLSQADRHMRWFTGAPDLDAATRWSADVDRRQRDGVVATTGDGEIVGHAAWARIDATRAEVAFEVADAEQGHGFATILLAHVAFGAHEQGIETLVAEVLPENHRMLDVLRDSGLPLHVHADPGVLHIELPAELTPDARRRFEQRDAIASVAAMDAVLRPRSLAVVGASPDPDSIGGAVFANLLTGGYRGALHAVNRRGRPIDGHVCHRSIADVPGQLDAAVLAIPAAGVLETARACAARRVRALIVLSAGFAETGPDGVALQHELLAVCRAGGMRLVGPNCLGVIDTDPAVRLNASFAPTAPPPGGVALLSQSGGVGIALLEQARALGIGVSAFVSAGNKADLSGNDFLQWCAQDERTRAILLYLESFGNPRKFARIARHVGRIKPIVAVKAGRSPAGARAAASHTGALLAGSERTVDALFRQAGVLRAETLGELLDLATLLERQPLPAGRRVAIVTNAGGPGILCADACQAAGLELPELPPQLRERLARHALPGAALANPVDLLAAATPATFEHTLETIAASGAVDALIAVFVPPLVTRANEIAHAIRRAARAIDRRVPLLSVFMTAAGAPAELHDPAESLPVFRYPEDAARVLARAADHAAWRARPLSETPAYPDSRPHEAAALIACALTRAHGADGTWLDTGEVQALLACHGIPLTPQRVVETATAAARAATELAGPIALKAIAPGLLHKSDVGAVALGLRTPATVRRAAHAMRVRLDEQAIAVEGFLVQAMAPAGVELLVGATSDPLFGPVVACGAGGVNVALSRDVGVRLAPLTDRDATELVRELDLYPLLRGHRGAPAVDVAALEDVVLRLSALVDAHPEIAELDCNPVIAHPDGAVVVDARVRVVHPAPPRPTPALRG
jgi:acyl-CoA synthetase (NDP forming)/RimJ/RimL family protein N-acetyltransferase